VNEQGYCPETKEDQAIAHPLTVIRGRCRGNLPANKMIGMYSPNVPNPPRNRAKNGREWVENMEVRGAVGRGKP